jgi:hypothetical protein
VAGVQNEEEEEEEEEECEGFCQYVYRLQPGGLIQ